jgi:hypothetical protein
MSFAATSGSQAHKGTCPWVKYGSPNPALQEQDLSDFLQSPADFAPDYSPLQAESLYPAASGQNGPQSK